MINLIKIQRKTKEGDEFRDKGRRETGKTSEGSKKEADRKVKDGNSSFQVQASYEITSSVNNNDVRQGFVTVRNNAFSGNSVIKTIANTEVCFVLIIFEEEKADASNTFAVSNRPVQGRECYEVKIDAKPQCSNKAQVYGTINTNSDSIITTQKRLIGEENACNKFRKEKETASQMGIVLNIAVATEDASKAKCCILIKMGEEGNSYSNPNGNWKKHLTKDNIVVRIKRFSCYKGEIKAFIGCIEVNLG